MFSNSIDSEILSQDGISFEKNFKILFLNVPNQHYIKIEH